MFKLQLNLKWKITLFVFLVIFLVIGVITYATYQQTGNIVLSQINERIAVIKEYQKGIIQDLVKRTNEQITVFSNVEDIYLFVNLLNNGLSQKDSSIKDMQNYYGQTIKTRSKDLCEQTMSDNAYLYAYITDSRGIKIADSRINENNISDYLGEQCGIWY